VSVAGSTPAYPSRRKLSPEQVLDDAVVEVRRDPLAFHRRCLRRALQRLRLPPERLGLARLSTRCLVDVPSKGDERGLEDDGGEDESEDAPGALDPIEHAGGRGRDAERNVDGDSGTGVAQPVEKVRLLVGKLLDGDDQELVDDAAGQSSNDAGEGERWGVRSRTEEAPEEEPGGGVGEEVVADVEGGAESPGAAALNPTGALGEGHAEDCGGPDREGEGEVEESGGRPLSVDASEARDGVGGHREDQSGRKGSRWPVPVPGHHEDGEGDSGQREAEDIGNECRSEANRGQLAGLREAEEGAEAAEGEVSGGGFGHRRDGIRGAACANQV
jgi:hypothetical protein